MKFAVIGDQFIRHEVMEKEVRKYFPDAEIAGMSTGWPLDISQCMFKGPEVSECDGREDDIIALAAGADYLITDIAPITRRVLDALPTLKAIGVTRGGAVNVNVEAATEKGIPIFNSPGRNLTAVGEFTVALVLSHLKNIPVANHDLRGGKWRGDFYSYGKVGREMSEIKIGIIGFGNIGRQTSRLFAALGSEVAVYDPFIPGEVIREAGYQCATLEELCRECDVISLHAKVTKDNYHMFGKEQIAMMKPDAVLINTARAELLDMDALYEALKERRIGGAALDVYEKEPIGKDSRYLELDNLTITPHIGGASLATIKRAVQMAISDINAYEHGEETRFCLNPEALKK